MIRDKEVSQKNPFFPDIKRVYYIINTAGNVSSHENFANMYDQLCPGVLQSSRS